MPAFLLRSTNRKAAVEWSPCVMPMLKELLILELLRMYIYPGQWHLTWEGGCVVTVRKTVSIKSRIWLKCGQREGTYANMWPHLVTCLVWHDREREKLKECDIDLVSDHSWTHTLFLVSSPRTFRSVWKELSSLLLRAFIWGTKWILTALWWFAQESS